MVVFRDLLRSRLQKKGILWKQMGVISQADTIFSSMNIVLSIVLLIVLPTAMYWIGKRKTTALVYQSNKKESIDNISGAEKLDHSRLVAYFLVVFIDVCFLQGFHQTGCYQLIFHQPKLHQLGVARARNCVARKYLQIP